MSMDYLTCEIIKKIYKAVLNFFGGGVKVKGALLGCEAKVHFVSLPLLIYLSHFGNVHCARFGCQLHETPLQALTGDYLVLKCLLDRCTNWSSSPPQRTACVGSPLSPSYTATASPQMQFAQSGINQCVCLCCMFFNQIFNL